MKKSVFDAVIIGGGVTAHFIARRLLKRGFSGAVVERNDEMANAPSTRNEGWLHCGSYHAWAIDDRQTAVNVARRCIYGHEQIIRDYPDAVVEEFLTPSLAVLNDQSKQGELEERWSAAGVAYRPLSILVAKQLAPQFAFPSNAVAFEVRERAMNTRVLLDAILTECAAHEAVVPNYFELLLGTTPIRFEDDNTLLVQDNRNGKRRLTAKVFIYCAGAGMADLMRRLHQVELPLRRFKTPLMTTRRLPGANIVCLLEREVTLMNHGGFSTIGLTRDNVLEGTDDEQKLFRQRKHLLQTTARKFFGSDVPELQTYCCTKVDFGSTTAFPDLEAQWREPIRNRFCVIPGKMTEAPFIADKLEVVIWQRLNNSPVAMRPGDKILKRESTDKARAAMLESQHQPLEQGWTS